MTVLGASWLFVPGTRPDRFEKAVASGADQVILDLEDAVAAGDKAGAREAVSGWLSGGGSGWVRVNAPGTVWHDDDIVALSGSAGLRGLVVPKSESPDDLLAIARRLSSTPILALVETALGVAEAASLAASPAVSGLGFGSVDFLLDLDAQESDEALAFARGALVVAARAAGLPGPVDGVTTETRDVARVAQHAARARRLGFGGKFCIHPAQVEPVRTAFAPSPAEIEWAEKVLGYATDGLDAGAGGVFELEGQMIDRPLLQRARRIIARAANPHSR